MAHLKKSANTTQAIFFVGPVLTEFRINRMAFVQPERTCLNIQMKHTYETTQIRSIRNSVNQVSTIFFTYVPFTHSLPLRIRMYLPTD